MIDSSSYHIEFPPNRVRGCLPRRSRPGTICPMAADRIKVIPRAEWSDLASQLAAGQGLKPFVRDVLDQASVGSCGMESSAGSVMVSRVFRGLDHVLLNPLSGYHFTCHGVDRGSSIDENLEFIREHGLAPESVWPRSKGWRAKPSVEAMAAALAFRIEEFYDISSIDEMVSAILQGYPVVYGANGHAVCKVRHLNENEGEDLNSWGPEWGDGGFGVWASYRAVNWQYGAWAIRACSED